MATKNINEMTVDELRDSGHAVIVWTPEELRGASVKHVQDRSIELGWGVIEALAEHGEEDDADGW